MWISFRNHFKSIDFIIGNEKPYKRLNLAQAFNPIGSLIGMIIAQVFVIGALRSDDYTMKRIMLYLDQNWQLLEKMIWG